MSAPVPLTEAQYRLILAGELGPLGTDTINTYWLILWQRYADYPLEVRYAKVKVAIIDILLGLYWGKTSLTVGNQTIDLSKWFDNLYKLKELALKEADSEMASAGGDPVVAQILQTAPIMPPPYYPTEREIIGEYVIDANDTRYFGDPYKPWYRRGRL